MVLESAEPLRADTADPTRRLAVAGAIWLFALHGAAEEDVHRVAILPSGSDTERRGLVRIANNSERSGTVSIDAIDESGRRFDPLTLGIAAGAVAEFTTVDLESGNPDIDLAGATGPGEGDWWLEIDSELDIETRVYADKDGFLTPLNDTAPRRGGVYYLVTFNPGDNPNQVGQLRLVNPGVSTVAVTVRGTDDRGVVSDEVALSLEPGTARTYTARELETGEGDRLDGALGGGYGKWRLNVAAAEPILVMSLLASPTGHLANLTVPPTGKSDGVNVVPLMPAASDAFHRQGFVRVVNRSPRAGKVRITAMDDTVWVYDRPELALGAEHAAHFNSDDLESGNEDKGLSGGTGPGEGDWRLGLTSVLELEVSSYIRTLNDGFVAAMHDTAPRQEGNGLTYHVPVFHPASHTAQESWLHMHNPGDEDLEVSIRGVDDAGDPAPEGEVDLRLVAGETRTLTAGQLEGGDVGLEGRLGTGSGRWRLYVAASGRLRVLSLGHSAAGPLANLSRGHAPAADGPDLVLESLLASATRLAAGETLRLSATVRNQGGRSSATTTLRYHRSDDDVISADDEEVGTEEVGWLTPLGSSLGAIETVVPNRAGAHYYGACADAVADEADTTNNCSLAVEITVPVPPPDLVVGSVSASPTNPETGKSFTLAATVRNRGRGESEATTLRFYRSVNSTITRADTEVGSVGVGSLASQDGSRESVGVSAPAEPGTYHYGACVDTVDRESDTGNNCSSAYAVAVTEPKPDLTVTASVSDASVLTGATFELTATVRNRGRGESGATTVRYYRSSDSAITASDVQIGSDAVSALRAGADTGKSHAVAAPATPGTHYYGACVDAVSRETDVGNNCSAAIRVSVSPPPPDLVVAANASESLVEPGSSFTLSATVRNQGSGASSATMLHHYRSTDATISTSDVPIGSDAVAALPAAGSEIRSHDVTAPTDPGNHYFGACVDAVAWESDTTNNCSTSVTVTVPDPTATGTPDLATFTGRRSLGGSLTAAGTRYEWTGRVLNLGYGYAEATTMRFFRWTSMETFDAEDSQVGTGAVPVLGPGNASSTKIELANPERAATYHHRVCVDTVAGELDSTNNCVEIVGEVH